MISLRPYQQSVVREVSSHYAAGLHSVLLQMPTGAGKTRTAAYIVHRFASTARMCLWTVHREELLMQAAMTFAEYGIEHTLICATSSANAIRAQQFREFGRTFVKAGSPVVIGSIQTIVRRLDSMPWLDPDLIVPDEAHLSLNATNRRIINHYRDRRAKQPERPAVRLLGLTATPRRLDRQSFDARDGGLYDVMVKGPSPKMLVDLGSLAPWVAYGPPKGFELAEADLTKRKGGDYDAAELAKELDAPKVYGDVVEHYRRHSHGLPAIGFCPTVESAQKFAQAFVAAGYRAISLDGQTDDAVRRRSLQMLGSGELDVVMSVSILVEGTDVPYATTALLLRKSESLALVLQAIGRVRRPHAKKERAILLDFVGVLERHGSPDRDHDWSLAPVAAGGKARADEPGDDGGIDAVVACPECRRYHEPAPACPHCGYVYPVRKRREMQMVDGRLVELDEAYFREAEDRQKRQLRAIQGQAKTRRELAAIGILGKRADKILEARAEKNALQERILADREAMQRHGIWLADVRRMKPSELRATLAKLAADTIPA